MSKKPHPYIAELHDIGKFADRQALQEAVNIKVLGGQKFRR